MYDEMLTSFGKQSAKSMESYQVDITTMRQRLDWIELMFIGLRLLEDGNLFLSHSLTLNPYFIL